MEWFLGGLKWFLIFIVSLLWIYMATRMIGRAVNCTFVEMFYNKNPNKGEKENGNKEKQT